MDCIHEKCSGKLVPAGDSYKCPVCSLQISLTVLKRLRPEYFEEGQQAVAVDEKDRNDKFRGWDRQRPNFIGY